MFTKINHLASYRLPKYALIVSKVVVSALFLLILYFTVIEQQDLSELYQVLILKLDPSAAPLLSLVGVLMFLNWILEAAKWQHLMRPVKEIGFSFSLRCVLIGLASSIFTPNRIGEYVGRVFASTRQKRWQAVVALTLGSVVQIAIIGCLGLISLIYLIRHVDLLRGFSNWHVGLIAAVVLVAWIGYFLSGSIVSYLSKSTAKWIQKSLPYWQFVENYDWRQMLQIFGLTFFRIGIYVLQYILLLRFFGITVSFDLAVSAVLVTYLVQTGLPLPTFLGLIARGEIVLLVWKYFHVNELSLLATSYGLWVLNVVMPALVGMVLVLKLEPGRIRKHEVN